jgi:hypothetical protein
MDDQTLKRTAAALAITVVTCALTALAAQIESDWWRPFTTGAIIGLCVSVTRGVFERKPAQNPP